MKTSLPKDDLNSYIPISSLSFISKILEIVVASCLRSHIRLNGLSNVLQSAYKQFHSTETALLKVHNDVTINMDKGKVTVLTLLDISAAFDTIDHTILIKCLSLWYGVSVFVVWCICLCGMVYLSLWYGVYVFVVWCICLCGMVYLANPGQFPTRTIPHWTITHLDNSPLHNDKFGQFPTLNFL